VLCAGRPGGRPASSNPDRAASPAQCRCGRSQSSPQPGGRGSRPRRGCNVGGRCGRTHGWTGAGCCRSRPATPSSSSSSRPGRGRQRCGRQGCGRPGVSRATIYRAPISGACAELPLGVGVTGGRDFVECRLRCRGNRPASRVGAVRSLVTERERRQAAAARSTACTPGCASIEVRGGRGSLRGLGRSRQRALVGRPLLTAGAGLIVDRAAGAGRKPVRCTTWHM